MSIDDDPPNVLPWQKASKPSRDGPVKHKYVACLTLIESPRFGTLMFGTLDCPVEYIHKMLDEINITRRHQAQTGCRGPRPRTP